MDNNATIIILSSKNLEKSLNQQPLLDIEDQKNLNKLKKEKYCVCIILIIFFLFFFTILIYCFLQKIINN